jgi:hypothetical protein
MANQQVAISHREAAIDLFKMAPKKRVKLLAENVS